MASLSRIETLGYADARLSASDSAEAAPKSLLRLITCGSVDDGKSTLIGRLLYDSKMLLDDQLAALTKDSAATGTQGQNLDFALLVDGLSAEREQGITIDVAYRFFATTKRKFIVADTPGHEQYTRNMATGASSADLAVILIDARKGVLTQTRRHSLIAKLLGIREIVVAVNKMDLVDYDQQRFRAIVEDFRAFADEAGIADFTAIPLSGLAGDNVSNRSREMLWYNGPTLIEQLESVPIRHQHGGSFRMAVQWVNRPSADFRGYSGRIGSGSVAIGDEIAVLPSGEKARIERIVTSDGALERGQAGQSVTLILDRELDCSRGDVIAGGHKRPRVSAQFEADIVWMDGAPLQPGRPYFLKVGTRTVTARVTRVLEVVDVNSFAAKGGDSVGLNDLARCEIHLDRALALGLYAEDRELGGFILIDRLSNATVAGGMVRSLAARETSDSVECREGQIFWLSDIAADERDQLARTMLLQRETMGTPTRLLRAEDLDALNQDLDADDEAERRRRLREVAVLIARAGMDVIITSSAAKDEAWPGKWITSSDLAADGALGWVI